MSFRAAIVFSALLAAPAFAQDPVTVPNQGGNMPPALAQMLSGMQQQQATAPAAPAGDNDVAQALMGMLAPQDTSNLQGLLGDQPAAPATAPAPPPAPVPTSAPAAPIQLSIGAWLLRPELSAQLTGLLPPALQQAGQALRFKHLFIGAAVPGASIQLHGLNVGGRLQVRCGTTAAGDAWRDAHTDTALGFLPIALPPGLPAPQALGRMLDLAIAINQGNVPYVMASAGGAPPTNSNAAAAGMMEAIGTCRAGACDSLDQLFPNSAAPGVNAGLTARLPIHDEFLRQGTAGASGATLLAAFCRAYPLPPLAAAATQPTL